MSQLNGRRGGIAATLAMGLLLVIAASPVSAANAKFGANVANGNFPSNAYSGTLCDHEIDGGSSTYACSWILMTAFNGGSATSPRAGQINKVKIINGLGGSFKLITARKNASGQFKVISRSATINYATDQCDLDCVVHKINIAPISVAKGDYLGIQAAKTSTLRCDSGGNKIALFTPPLAPGGAYTTPTDYSGCFLMVQAVLAP